VNNEIIRSFCLSLPATSEDLKWESDLCFCVGGKIFCLVNTGVGFSVCLKCTTEKFAELCERDGISPAPYLARNYWVLVEKVSAFHRDEWKSLIKQSYDLVVKGLPKKRRAELGLE
jgi:predicted DNA-binding protein (MmcQ/YjbR family)